MSLAENPQDQELLIEDIRLRLSEAKTAISKIGEDSQIPVNGIISKDGLKKLERKEPGYKHQSDFDTISLESRNSKEDEFDDKILEINEYTNSIWFDINCIAQEGNIVMKSYSYGLDGKRKLFDIEPYHALENLEEIEQEKARLAQSGFMLKDDLPEKIDFRETLILFCQLIKDKNTNPEAYREALTSG